MLARPDDKPHKVYHSLTGVNYSDKASSTIAQSPLELQWENPAVNN
jgi:hypothetical protein